jgi:single-strand DNA-binding protein
VDRPRQAAERQESGETVAEAAVDTAEPEPVPVG